MTPPTCYLKDCTKSLVQGNSFPFCSPLHKAQYASTHSAKVKGTHRKRSMGEIQAALLVLGKEVADKKRGQRGMWG